MFIKPRKLLNNRYIFFVPILIYLVLSIVKLEQPGIYFDETLFLNAALGGIDNTSIYSRIGNIPFYLYPYIGALKAYLYFPIFQLFPVSAYSIRLPVILITCIALFLLYRFLEDSFNNKIGFITLLLLSLNPVFISLVRTDTGPVAIEFFLKVSSLYIFFNLLKKNQIINLLFLLVVLALGLFNKLNFIWFINVLFFGGSIIYWKSVFLNTQKKLNFLNLALFIISYLTLLFWFIRVDLQISFKNTAYFSYLSVVDFFKNYYHFVAGESFFRMVYQFPPTKLGLSFSIINLLGFTLGLVIYYLLRRRLTESFQNNTKFIFIIYILLLLQILFTPLARSGWHYFSLFPFFEILISCFLYLGYKYQKDIGYYKKFIFLFGSIIIFYPLVVTLIHITSLDNNPSNIYWSNKIYDLINYTRSKDNKFISVDWGTHNQLLGFDYIPNKYVWVGLDSEDVKPKIDKYINPGTNFILYKKSNSFSLLSKLVKDYNVNLVKIHEIKDKNKTVFEIYGLEKY